MNFSLFHIRKQWKHLDIISFLFSSWKLKFLSQAPCTRGTLGYEKKTHKTLNCYLVVYLDLCECFIVSQRIDQSLHPHPCDKIGLQVQSLQRLVHPQHLTERLRRRKRKDQLSVVDRSHQTLSPLHLTTAIGSLLRVAARLNFLTCVFFSMALAKSFNVGIGMFWKSTKGVQPLVQAEHKYAEWLCCCEP